MAPKSKSPENRSGAVQKFFVGHPQITEKELATVPVDAVIAAMAPV
jgi:hypothetical protein